jgi:hypothetical protein
MSGFKYGFSYNRDDSDWVNNTDNDGAMFTTATKSITYTDCTPWTTVLEDFITFLGSCYGYDIRDQVEFQSVYSRVVNNVFKDEDDDKEELLEEK